MRILAVAHVLHFFKRHVQVLWIRATGGMGAVRAQAGQVVGDGAVVLGRVGIHLGGQAEAGFVADETWGVVGGFHFRQHHAVVGWIADHDHVLVILGRRAQHGRAADVDVFDGVVERAVFLGNSCLERVQIDHHHVDGRNVVLGQLGHVLGEIAAGQDATVHFRVQGLDAAIEHFREAGVVGHFGHGQAVVGQHFGGAAGGQELDAHGGQRASEVQHTGFVGNGDES